MTALVPVQPRTATAAPGSPTLPDTVVLELRDALIRGRLAPGDPIRADAVAAGLGISVIPVREALRVLLAEGRVTYVPHRGYRVATFSFREIEEVFLLCRLLEREASRWGIPAMTDTAVERMRALLARLEAAETDAGAGEAAWELVQTHQAFHFVPMEAAGLPRLLAMLRALWDHTTHVRTLYLFASSAEPDASTRTDHRSLFDACSARDVERAVRLMDTHRDHVLERMRRVVRGTGAR